MELLLPRPCELTARHRVLRNCWWTRPAVCVSHRDTDFLRNSFQLLGPRRVRGRGVSDTFAD